MSYEQAFQYVKSCRPIIHPNVGFIHQLKKYEEKLKMPVEKTLPPLCYADDSVLKEVIENEAIDIPIPPLKHGKANHTVHEPFQTLSEKYEIVGVQICDNTVVKTKKAIPERLGLSVQGGHPVASSWQASRSIGPVKETSEINIQGPSRGKRKTAFTRLTKPNEIAVSFWNIPLDLALASNDKNNKFKIQIKPEVSTLAVAELLLSTSVDERIAYESVRNLPSSVATPVRAKSVLTFSSVHFVTQHQCIIYDQNGSITFVADNNNNNNDKAPTASAPTNRLSRQPSIKTNSLRRFGRNFQTQHQLNSVKSQTSKTVSRKEDVNSL